MVFRWKGKEEHGERRLGIDGKVKINRRDSGPLRTYILRKIQNINVIKQKYSL